MPETIGDWATWIGSVGAIVIAIVAGIAAGQIRRRERRQALVDLHAILTSGEIAAARNTIGTLLYSRTRRTRPTRLESIEAYFQLVWAVQRARNTFLLYGFAWPATGASSSTPPKRRRSERDPEQILSWNLSEIAENVQRFHREYADRWGVEDRDAWAEVSDYLRAE
ncbi:hypothetical protein ACDF64_07830 [Agromyces sp. MMS24-JH15]|uniref:hypothetical protein n=1 Tax=Agromyces sp. MMS24-JH15 TaxID=3243765 RepID=UPI00374984B9